MNRQPTIAVVIVVWNGVEDTLECLRSFRGQTHPETRIIIVDNGSTDDSVKQIGEQFPEAEILQTGRNLGFTGGNNVGIRHAIAKGDEYIFLLNNDTAVEPDTLAKLLASALENPKAGLLVPVIHYFDPPREIWFSGSRIDLHRGTATHDNSRLPGRGEQPYEIPWANGCAMFLPAALLRGLDGFDDRYYLTWEDVDLSLRVRACGRGVMAVPQARIYHKCARSGQKLSGIRYYYAVRNSLLLFSLHGGRAYPRAASSIIASYLWRCARGKFEPGGRMKHFSSVVNAVRDHLIHRYGPCLTES